MKFTKQTVLPVILSTLCISGMANASNSFLVAPGKIETSLIKSETNTLILTNNGSEKIRLTLEPEYIPLSGDKGLGVGEPISLNTEDDLTDYVTVSPKIVVLNPGERRDIKVNINGNFSRSNPNAKKLALDGDYRTHIIVKMSETAEKQKLDTNGAEGVTMNLNINFETAVAVYSRLGEPQFSAVTASCKDNSITISNPTPFKLDGLVKLKSGEEKRVVVMRESKRTIEMESDSSFWYESNGTLSHIACK